MGVTFTIDTDAHTPSGFNLLRYGVDEARRGWLEKGDVLNTRELAGLRTLLETKHQA
jgi:DNA polymerase (family 10)